MRTDNLANRQLVGQAFKQAILERVRREPEFARAPLGEAAILFVNDEADAARLLVCDLVDATVGCDGPARRAL